MQARVHLRSATASPRNRRSCAPARPACRPSETAHLLAHALLLQGDAAAPRSPRRRGAAPAHAAYAARIARPRLHGARRQRRGRAPPSTARSRLAPNDSEVWTDVARFRRANGDVAGAIEAADRAVAADAAQRRGADPARRADPQPIWPRRRHALVRPGARGRSGQRRRPARARRHLWRHRPDDATCSPTRARSIGLTGGHPTAYYLQAMLAARGARFRARPKPLQPHRRRLRRHARPACCSPARSISRPAMRSRRRGALSRLRRDAAGQPQGPPPARRRPVADAAMPPPRSRTLRPLADRPDADAYTLSADRPGASAARRRRRRPRSISPAPRAPQPVGARRARDPLGDGEFAGAAPRRRAPSPATAPPRSRLISRPARPRPSATRRCSARAGSRRPIPARPKPICWSATRSASSGDFAGRRRALSPRRQPRLHRAGGAPPDRGAAALRARPGGATRCSACSSQQNPRNVPALILLAGADDAGAATGPPRSRIYERLRQRLGNNDATMLNNLAWAYAESGDYDRAVPLARRAWALDRDNPATADTLGWLLFKSGEDRAGGLALLEQAARGAPTRRGDTRASEGRAGGVASSSLRNSGGTTRRRRRVLRCEQNPSTASHGPLPTRGGVNQQQEAVQGQQRAERRRAPATGRGSSG